MKILAVSHSCITDVNQQLYVALSAIDSTSVELIIPSEWKSEYADVMLKPGILPDVVFPIRALPVAVPGNNSLYFFRSGLRRAIREAGPDLVFIDEEPWSLACAQIASICREFRLPYVCYTKQNLHKRYPPPFNWVERRTYRSSAAIVALSEEVRTVLRRKGFRGNCPLLAHACDLSLFTPQNVQELRAQLGLRGMVVGYMGRLVPEKGLRTIFGAAERLLAQAPEHNVSILFVGSGPEEAVLREMAEDAGVADRTVFAGVVPHTAAGTYMNLMDVFVLPSRTTPRWKEQFGRVIIEAMACGVPVLGSDSGQIPYVIADTGGGLTFKEGSDEELARHLRTLLCNPVLRNKLGRDGMRSVQRSYTYPAIARDLHSICASALRRAA